MAGPQEPIEIWTLEDALNALNRSRGSFEEWLECAAIFAKYSRWRELERAAELALESATKRTIRPALLADAAKRFAAGSLGDFKNKSDFELNCRKSSNELIRIKSTIPVEKKRMRDQIDSLMKVLDEILILLSDGSPEALTSIAARLRKKLGRPDLAIRVADIALKYDPLVIPGYVTRGSAFTDIGNYSSAVKDFEFAEKYPKSRTYAIAGYTRLLIRQGNFKHALIKGEELFLNKISRPLILLLIAAARGANDKEKFERLIKLAESVKDTGKGSGRTLLMRQAIRILIENEQFETAQELLDELTLFDRPSQISSLKKQLNQAQKLSDQALKKSHKSSSS